MTKNKIDEYLSILGLDCYYENSLKSFSKHDCLTIINWFDLFIEPEDFLKSLLKLYKKHNFRDSLIKAIYYNQ